MVNDIPLADYAWPITRLGELVENLALRSKLIAHPGKLPQPPEILLGSDDEAIGNWIDAAAGHFNLEAESITTQYADVETLIRAGSPAIVRLPGILDANQPRLIALLRGGSRKVSILKPDLRVRRVNVEAIRSALCFPYDYALLGEINQLLDDIDIPPERQTHARRAILREQLGPIRIPAGWLLRLSPGTGFSTQFRKEGLYWPLMALFGLYFLQILLSVASWILIGRGVFQGYFNMGWLVAWMILLFATIPLQIFISDAQSELSMKAGVLSKQKLLFGILKLEPEEIRHQGRGQFLGRVMESEAVEMLAISGGFLSLLSFVQLVVAGFILSKGAGGALHALMLAVWVLLILVIIMRYYRNSRKWAEAYREITNDLVENMVGHRTRLAQADPNHWHDEEDQVLDQYIKLSERLDRIGIQLNAVATRGWIIIGLLGLILPFIANTSTIIELAISLGGILLASQAINQLAGGSQSLVSLFIAWQQVGPLLHAASRPAEIPSLDYVSIQELQENHSEIGIVLHDQTSKPQSLLQARDIDFRYRPHTKPVVHACSLQINTGDRLLLEGASGSGKTTLAAILSGLRVPESGTLLLWGFDRSFVGSQEWHRRVAMAPQFQENHVFSETLGFNLLMGRRWPPLQEDLDEAETICGELGLGELLKRMPSGFQQMLGESGWQLSHGERSRLFIARSLLQKAELIILDESFGSLDPENLKLSLRTALDRARTILVIAHP